MTNKITTVFALSVLGGTYQFSAWSIAYLVDHRIAYLSIFGLGSSTLTSLVVFWSAVRFMEERARPRIMWPSLIFAMGSANLVNILVMFSQPPPQLTSLLDLSTSVGAILAMLPAPLLLMVAGIVGFTAVRQVGREGEPTPVTKPATTG